MNKSEFIKILAEGADMSQKEAEVFTNAFISVITESLRKGNKVKLTGFGSFESVKRAAREGVNPSTGEKIKISSKFVPKFTAGKTLKTETAKRKK
ncbi:MAG: HU family DNA-binding protein [Lachnospiraceae bacterium]|nr:HU family DNA-binding protein [Lachnospiraceae bacterium]